MLTTLWNFAQAPSEAMRRYFASRIVQPAQLPGIMRKHIYTGAMGGIYAYLTASVFFVYYGNRIGLTPFHWGLINGFASCALVAQLFSPLLIGWAGGRKALWFFAAVLERVLRIVGIFLAYDLWRQGNAHSSAALIACLCLSSLFSALSSPPWLSWLADIIPADRQGRFWGLRAAWISGSVMAVMLFCGLVMDRVPEGWKLGFTLLLFAVGGVIGLADLVIHGTIPEPLGARTNETRFLTLVMTPLRDRAFRPWLLFAAAWSFAALFADAVASPYCLKNLEVEKNLLGGVIVLPGLALLGAALTSTWSGRLVDRIGVKPVLFGGYFFAAMPPLLWAAATPRTAMAWLAAASLLTGAAGAAAVNAANKLVTRHPPPELRAMYVAVPAALASLAAGAGAVAGGTMLRLIGDWRLSLAGAEFGGFHLVFTISAALRLAAVLLIIPRLRRLAGLSVNPENVP